MKHTVAVGIPLFCTIAGVTAVIWTARPGVAEGHCQVPCGIYDDPARIAQFQEDAATIAKAIQQITELAGKHDALAFNQATRWITTKEAHAAHIMQVVSEYFLAQKVKPVAPGAEGYEAYLKMLADHHALLVAAMKTKQTVDPAAVDELRHAIEALAKHYKK